MMFRFVLLAFAGVGCWLLTSQCLSKKIDFVHVRVVEPSQEGQTKRTAASFSLPKWNELLDTYYSYDDYLFDIPQKMVKSEREYQLRKAIFDANLNEIRTFNQQQGGHRLGLNHFMDLLPEELPRPGYDKSQHAEWNRNAIDNSILSTSDSVVTTKEHPLDYWSLIDLLTTTPESLPQHVDWRTTMDGKPLTTPIKNQGKCGSCWAFATTAALESHVALNTPNHTLMSLSMQELISCSSNPNHCGGTGGCSGSTAELALGFIQERGLLDEWHFGYQSYSGDDKIKCNLQQQYYEDAVVTVEGHVKLPANNYTALMHAVAKHGPVIVNVAATPWKLYEEGVFSPRGHGGSITDINHVVVLMGYGTDKETGEDYWLVRNSYGPQWGEAGYIRLKRVDPSTLPQPDADCGMDIRPADGIACTKDEQQHHITPPAVKVCGTSGILFDPVLPIGAKLIV